MSFTFQVVVTAAESLCWNVLVTSCTDSRTLSRRTDAELFLKFENLQFTTAFKKRGALNKGLDLTPAQCVRGVIAMSAENRCGKLGLGTDKPHEKAL